MFLFSRFASVREEMFRQLEQRKAARTAAGSERDAAGEQGPESDGELSANGEGDAEFSANERDEGRADQQTDGSGGDVTEEDGHVEQSAAHARREQPTGGAEYVTRTDASVPPPVGEKQRDDAEPEVTPEMSSNGAGDGATTATESPGARAQSLEQLYRQVSLQRQRRRVNQTS